MSASRGVVIPPVARRLFGAVQAVSPALAARLVERWFFTPPRRALSGGDKAFLRSGRRFGLRVSGRGVTGWTWGTGPVVYLMHGWGGRAGRWSAIAAPLVASGYTVVTFDAPGHGASGRGLTSGFDFARTLRAVADRYGPARALIAHALGAPAAILATRWGLAVDRVALLAPAADPAAFADAFAAALKAAPEVMTRMRANSERRLGASWTVLDLVAAAPGMRAPLLVVHDEHDDDVPITEGAAVAASWPGARLVTTTGLGHRGVLRDPRVVAEVVRFVVDASGIPEPASETGRLEHELFNRDVRRY